MQLRAYNKNKNNNFEITQLLNDKKCEAFVGPLTRLFKIIGVFYSRKLVGILINLSTLNQNIMKKIYTLDF